MIKAGVRTWKMCGSHGRHDGHTQKGDYVMGGETTTHVWMYGYFPDNPN